MMLKLNVNDECKVSAWLGIGFSAFQSFPRPTLANPPTCIISLVHFRSGRKNKDQPLVEVLSSYFHILEARFVCAWLLELP